MGKTQESVYLRFLSLCQALDRKQRHEVDATAMQLLGEIGVAEFNESPKSVTELMALTHIASPATVHRKLDDLIKSGLVATRFALPDRRTKRVHVTAKGHKFFASRDKLLALALRAT